MNTCREIIKATGQYTLTLDADIHRVIAVD